MLRIFTAGHVDDGKSTLIGRLLYDSCSVFEDQLLSLQRDSIRRGFQNGTLDYSLLTDGLKAEREQGITIDVAYRYFSTPKRSFILADSPGHEQYTRNMATAASNADLLLLLIDARRSIAEQTKRHSLIASLLGIKHFCVAINKMDLVDCSKEVFESIRGEFAAFAKGLGIDHVHYIPVSALRGDNIVARSDAMPWYEGPPLLEFLENFVLPRQINQVGWRLPVQYVLRSKERYYAGTVEMGQIRKGDEAVCLPSKASVKIRSIIHREHEVEWAEAGQAVAVNFDREIDASRGCTLSSLENPVPLVQVKAMLIWMDSQAPARVHSPYLLMHTAQTVSARIEAIHHCIDVLTLEEKEAVKLSVNEIGMVTIAVQKPIFADDYRANRTTGSFILIDPNTNQTIGAGLIQNRS